MGTYAITYWTGRVETVSADSARDAALTVWDAKYLDRYSVDPELLGDPDMMEIMSEYFDFVAAIVKA
jgi:hypothetical protein